MDNKHECVAYKQDTGTSTQKQFAACLAGNQNKFSVSELVTVLRSQSPGLVQQVRSSSRAGTPGGARGCRTGGSRVFGLLCRLSSVLSERSLGDVSGAGTATEPGSAPGKGSHRPHLPSPGAKDETEPGGGKGKVSVPVSGSRAELLGTTAGAAGASSGG